jgi:hypothetical protein
MPQRESAARVDNEHQHHHTFNPSLDTWCFIAQTRSIPCTLIRVLIRCRDFAPAVLSESVQTLLEYTNSNYYTVTETLTMLVLNSTWDEDSNPLTRDGAPNRLMQKLLRELNAVDTVVRMISAPFERGIIPRWLHDIHDERFMSALARHPYARRAERPCP